MPKVGNIEFRIEGKPRKFDLMYSQSDGFFLKGFPSNILEIASAESKWCNTEVELITYYKNIIDIYHVRIKNTKKVILYSLALPTEKRMNRTGYGSYQGFQAWIPSNINRQLRDMHGDGFGFQLHYRILKRVDTNGTKYFDLKDLEDSDDMRVETTKKNDEFEIDWTQAREDFFKSLETQVDEMIKKMVLFFSKDQQQLLQIFDSGSVKLLGTPNKS